VIHIDLRQHYIRPASVLAPEYAYLCATRCYHGLRAHPSGRSQTDTQLTQLWENTYVGKSAELAYGLAHGLAVDHLAHDAQGADDYPKTDVKAVRERDGEWRFHVNTSTVSRLAADPRYRLAPVYHLDAYRYAVAEEWDHSDLEAAFHTGSAEWIENPNPGKTPYVRVRMLTPGDLATVEALPLHNRDYLDHLVGGTWAPP